MTSNAALRLTKDYKELTDSPLDVSLNNPFEDFFFTLSFKRPYPFCFSNIISITHVAVSTRQHFDKIFFPHQVGEATPSDADFFVWNGAVFGTPGTPWEGGVYAFKMKFPQNYPEAPPEVRFVCEMFHPNVFPNGSLCLDIIKEKWRPIYTVSSIIVSISSLLDDPNILSPANSTAAEMYQNDRKKYNQKVRQCAEKSIQ